MKRKAEKLLMMAGGIWNIVAAALTIFGYSGWFREEGTKVLSHVDKADYANTSLLDNLVQVAMIYGLFILIMGIVTLFVARLMEGQIVDRKIMIWLGVCTVISFVSFDVIGIFFYLAALVIYLARNKALKSV